MFNSNVFSYRVLQDILDDRTKTELVERDTYVEWQKVYDKKHAFWNITIQKSFKSIAF